MISVTVSYPNGEGKTFDHTYYREKHIPLALARLGGAIRPAEIDRALGGPDPAVPVAWIASGRFYLDSVEAFQSSFGPHAAEILGDIPNFTNIQPQIVISEPFTIV